MVALFVAFMFVSLVLVDLGMEKWKLWRTAQAALARRRAVAMTAAGLGEFCQLPEGVHLTSQHTWIKADPAAGLQIGADALIARAVGAVQRIILPRVGDQVTSGQPLFRLERNGCVVTIPATLTGQVMGVNDHLIDHPELLGSDPYGKGWVCQVIPTRGQQSDSRALRFGEPAVMWLEREAARFAEFIFGQMAPDLALGTTNLDGGIPAPGCLGELGPKAWSAFEASFLQPS